MTVAALFHRPPTGPDADRDLLRRFADRRDDGAFAALVRRYGRLVFATCLRVLSHRADAEDAYQATFLVLARRATAIRSDEKLAGWLHTVAVRTATEVRRMRDRRRQAEATPSLTLPAPTDPLESRELAAVLDEELARLPDHYRLAVVLCELNGVGRKAAAKELGIAEGTLSSRLAKARKLLADRLTGRGFGAVSAGALTAALANSAVARIPAAALDFGAAGGILNLTIHSVADTVVKAMFATKLKAGALVAVLLALAGGVVWTTAAGAGPGGQPAPAKEKPDPAEPLVARLGSKEFAEREAAEKKLREMGAAALPAIRAGLKSDSPEVVKRCEKLIAAIRKDPLDRFVAEFKKDTEFRQPFDHPVWTRWADVIGTTRGCRELFDEMLLVPDAADILDAVERKPETAKEVYKEQLLKWYAIADKRTTADPKVQYGTSMGYSGGEKTFLAYLATFPGCENVLGTDISRAEIEALWGLRDVQLQLPGPLDLNGPNGRVVTHQLSEGTEAQRQRARQIRRPSKWLFQKVLATRADPRTLLSMLSGFDVPEPDGRIVPGEVEGIARAIFTNEKLPAKTRVYTLRALTSCDAVDLASEIAKFLDDKTHISANHDTGGKPNLVRACDMAMASLLLLHKQDLHDFDFPDVKKGMSYFAQNSYPYQGFPDDTTRAAAYEKAKAFLASAGKPKKRPALIDPTIQSRIEQLGDKRPAKRDEAEQALVALGIRAYFPVYFNFERANPEIGDRCRRVYHKLKPAKPEDDLIELYHALGRTELDKRVAAEKRLQEMGADALPALQAGLRSEHPETVKASERLLARLNATQPKVAPKKDDPAVPLTLRLGSKDFAEREAAEKALKGMAAAAFAAVTAGLKSDNPEVVARCRKLLPAIRKAVTVQFAEAFLADKEQTKAFDHPVWMRFAAITGDSKASRAIFAEVLSYDYPNGLLALDEVERQPDRAVALFTECLCGLLKDYDPLDAKKVRSGIRPTDLIPHADTRFAAYTLFLGSYRSSAATPASLSQADSLRYTNAWSGAVNGQGLLLGLTGKFAVGQPDTKPGLAAPPATTPGPAGTDAALARLYLQFLASERPDATRGFYYGGWDWATPSLFEPNELPNRERTRLPLPLHKLALPVARRMVADATAHPSARAFWIPLLYRFGDRADANRLTGLFADATPLVIRQGGNLSVQVREWAAGTALLLRGRNPAKFGFDRFDTPPEREFDLPDYPLACFAVREPGTHKYATDIKERDPAAKEKVLKAAIEWLDEEARKEKEPPKQDDPAPALVAQLGSKEFAEREAAEKALRAMGAAAYAAVTAGLKSDNPEIVRRCQKLMPVLRAAHLARPESEVWKRFVAIAGDTPHARELFLEMAAEPERAASLMAENPAKEYAAVAENAVRAIRAKYDARERDAQRTGIDRLGRLLLSDGGRGEAALLFFLGSSPETAGTAPKIDERDRSLWHNYLQEAFMAGKPDGRKFPPEVRQLIAGWLGGRTNQTDVRAGLMFARFHRFAEVLPVARAMLADDRRTSAEKTPALYALAQMGTEDDLKRVVPFLESDAEYHRTKYTHTDGKSYPLTVEVRDVAHAAVGKLLGADLADLGFEFCQKGDADDALSFRYDHFAGFTTADKRATAHANVRKLLKNAPVPKDFGPPKRPKLPKAALPGAKVKAALAELDDALAGRRERDPPGMERKLEALVKATNADEDKARLYHHAATLLTNSTSPNFARAGELATKCLEVSKDPVLRWKARSLQASAIYLSGVKFDERRRKQAEVLLTGYVELLAQDLPDADPEWPASPGKLDRNDEAPGDREAHEARQVAYSKARADAEFVKEQVFGRTVLLMQLRDAYKPAPNDPRRNDDGVDELRALAAKAMTEREVSTLMKRVLEEK